MRRLLAVLPCLLLLAAAPTQASTAKPRIVGGTVSSTTYSAQALVLITVGPSRYMCGGTLVAPTKVVTAAHCLDGANIGSTGSTSVAPQAVPASALTVYLGSNLQMQGTRYAASDAVIEPAYDPDAYASDAGVITLSTTATQTPLRLADPDTDATAFAAGQTARVLGWGTTRSGGSSSSSLREVDIPIVADATCASRFGSNFVASVMTCAGASGKDACQGDSGGPLMVSTTSGWALAGIVSWGYGCATPGYYGVYTEATSTPIRTWLLAQIAATSVAAAANEPAETTTTQTTPVATTTTPAPTAPAPAPAIPATAPVATIPAATPVPTRVMPVIVLATKASSRTVAVSGRVLGGECRGGKLKLAVSRSGTRLATRTLGLSANCSFRATVSAKHATKVKLAFTGSDALLPVTKVAALSSRRRR